ncbi:MAG: histidine-type phosphatase [Reyranella sp.]|uniref:histidine-type phosphatase n=1 Tax=Reyranella sp. TaxID=1929291 RepID=UPI003D14894E
MKRRHLGIIVIAAVLAAFSPAAVSPVRAQILPIPPGWQMERAVLVSRHGVRAPFLTNVELDSRSASPWPTWPVPPGFLTPRGEELLRLMGRYYRVLYGGRGLVQSDDCPPRGTVSAWADLDQRTRASAVALLTGMYPRCPTLNVRNQDDPTVPDPLFHPQPTASCPMDGAANRAAVLARIGGNFDSVQREYAPQLTLMQQTLCPTSLAGGKACGLATGQPGLESRPDGTVRLTGSLGFASAAAETFAMEDAEGMQVAWGRLAGEAELQDLLKLHRLEVDLVDKTLPLARQHGSNLLNQIVATLQDGHDFPGQPRIAEPVRFALLVGHSTNLANLSRLLNIGWQIAGFQPNQLSPGGALAFELYREVRTGQRYVRLAYYAQTMAQMRGRIVLEATQPPGMTAVALPACAADEREKACPVERFVEIARQAIDPACVSVKP